MNKMVQRTILEVFLVFIKKNSVLQIVPQFSGLLLKRKTRSILVTMLYINNENVTTSSVKQGGGRATGL